MQVRFRCQVCLQRYRMSIDVAGRRFDCKVCQTSLSVPVVIVPAEYWAHFQELAADERLENISVDEDKTPLMGQLRLADPD